MKRKQPKKYPWGTGKNGLQRHSIESPQETMADYNIMIAKAKMEAENNPWAKGIGMLGSMAMQYGMSQFGAGGMSGGVTDMADPGFSGGGGNGGANLSMSNNTGYAAMGGEVGSQKVEVEGGESAELPDGGLLEFKGAAHKDGGIDVNLPEGTDIFSKRISVKGETMAQRQSKRSKRELRLAKLLDNNPYDKVLESTFKRTQEVNAVEKEKDVRLQKAVRMVKDLAKASTQKAAYGLTTGENDPENPLYANMSPEDFLATSQTWLQMNGEPENPLYANMSPEEFLATSQIWLQMNDDTQKSSGAPTETNPLFADPNASANQLKSSDMKGGKSSIGDSFKGLNAGDYVGMAGTLYSAFAPMANTEEARAGDTPNINAFKDYGNDALDRIDSAKGYIEGQKSKALMDIEKGQNRNMINSRKSARGVNTLRSLDLAADVAATDQKGDVFDQFSKNMMQLLSTQAGFENQQDQAVMAGEQARDLADRQDRDNYYSQLAQDIASKGQGIQQSGKMLNEAKYNKEATAAVNATSQDFKFVNGQLQSKDGKVVMSTPELQAEAARLTKKLGRTITVEQVADMYSK